MRKTQLRKVGAINLFFSLTILVLFSIRQVLVASDLALKETELAGQILSDFLGSVGAVTDLSLFLVALLFLHLILAAAAAFVSGFFLVLTRVGAWTASSLGFLLVLLLVLVWDAILYPNSLAGFMANTPFATPQIAVGLSFLVILLMALGFALSVRQAPLLCSVPGIVLAGALWLLIPGQERVLPEAERSHPNVVIIGIDALRPDHLGARYEGFSLTPNIDGFVSDSVNYSNAFTPVARTYSAWFALLSGRYPTSTGVRFNLQQFNDAQLADTDLQARLKDQGYHTVYAMDERRFNNIDERYGFDSVVGPKIGAADFLLFHAAEIPSIAFVANTDLGKKLFPFIYMNRGVHSTYMPEVFTQNLLDEVAQHRDKPLFLATHLTLPHWPYLYRDLTPDARIPYDPEQPQHYLYQLMLQEVDDQFQDLMDGLERIGVLDNALVFVVSDHGEGFMLEDDALEAGLESITFPTSGHGHGTNVLSEEQFNVVMAVQDRRDGYRAHSDDSLVSLLDIAPTVLKWLDEDADISTYSGSPLAAVVECEGCESASEIFIESSVATNAMYQSQLDAMQVMAEGIGFYTVTPEGLAITRPEFGELLRSKQRAVVSDDFIVAHFPGLTEGFLVVERGKGTWWPSSQYGGDKPSEAATLIRRLCSFYSDDQGFDQQGLCKPFDSEIAVNE
ncbi:sulfatase-like hydrolase/transferase [Marinobacter arenosus]|uniref:sulfatase-like hydrolase/transferase n=1 Tax=Marinobacter arenosus TaxID=2856822 RepID=UPI001C4B2159|nr:sulfatase-like hydrolase/transferase [Marinobacter arenosus]MBW0146847.1 sulfatase-like hydrolase/transferase [Marinobacter arenosus]